MSGRAARTSPVAAAVLAALLAPGGRAAADEPAPLCGGGSLDILVTNDDGWQSPGIRALYQALRAAGHRVMLAAPDRNASGSSASVTWTPVTVSRDPQDPALHGVSTTPASSAVFGITTLYPAGRRPDLVISGINDGDNAGAQLVISGTVGAALAGTLLVDPPVPGIAVSAERPETGDTRAGSAEQRYAAIARHLAGLLGATRGWFCDAQGRVRGTAALNVNYPSRPVADIAGVAAARQAQVADMSLRYAPRGADRYEVERSYRNAEAPPDSDLALLARGYVTVTPIGPGLVPGGSIEDLARRIDRR